MGLLGGLKRKKIDRIRRANAQRHVSGSLTDNGGQKFKNKIRLIKKVTSPCHVCTSMTILVPLTNTMIQKGCFIDIFVVLVLHRRARSATYSLIMSRKICITVQK